MAAVALDRRVPGRVDQVDGDRVRVDDVVGRVQGSDLLVPRDDSVLAHVSAGKEIEINFFESIVALLAKSSAFSVPPYNCSQSSIPRKWH